MRQCRLRGFRERVAGRDEGAPIPFPDRSPSYAARSATTSASEALSTAVRTEREASVPTMRSILRWSLAGLVSGFAATGSTTTSPRSLPNCRFWTATPPSRPNQNALDILRDDRGGWPQSTPICVTAAPFPPEGSPTTERRQPSRHGAATT